MDRWPGQSCTKLHREHERYMEIRRGSTLQKAFVKIDGRLARAKVGRSLPLDAAEEARLTTERQALLSDAWAIYRVIDDSVVARSLEQKQVAITEENVKAQKAYLIF